MPSMAQPIVMSRIFGNTFRKVISISSALKSDFPTYMVAVTSPAAIRKTKMMIAIRLMARNGPI